MRVIGALATRVMLPEDETTLRLSEPFMHGGNQVLPFMEALRRRRSTRAFSSERLSEDLLSTLLWAAAGINRPGTHGRTAPSARAWQEIDVYAALPQGLYRYDAPNHALILVVATDIRAVTGVQDFVANAAIDLIYVADFSRMTDANEEDRKFYSATDAAAIAENVYLFCAATGLATVLRGSIDRRALASAMLLGPEQRVILAQSVGFSSE